MYIGVKDLISEFKEPFDRIGKATKQAKRNLTDRGEKAVKELVDEEVKVILAEWDRKRVRGEKYQEKLCEKEVKKNPSKTVLEKYHALKSKERLEVKCARVENNMTYLEKKLFSNKYNIVGYADRVDVSRGTINITDNKVVEKIYMNSAYTLDNGFRIPPVKMLAPINHLDSCNYNDFALQLSLYMYLAWESNKRLKIGKLYIRHIKMNDKDKVISDELIEVPYMKDEVKQILKYRLLNAD